MHDFRYHKSVADRESSPRPGLIQEGGRAEMKPGKSGIRAVLLLILCACLCLMQYAFADSGVEKDEDGGIWDFNAGTYTDPQGNVYDITPGGVQEDDSGAGTVQNPDGSITVITGETDSVQHNPDGSIQVESGQIQAPEEAGPTRAPIEGEEWQALLAGVAARNGTDTPTVWTDPDTGESSAVEVAYMGVGRSMIRLNGKEKMVNTVNLKWQTEAPEDKVLAMVDAPRDGYTWMRKAPNTKKTNPKIQQIRTNTVLRVIRAGNSWTLVVYEGLCGYVPTSALEFFRNDHTDFETGVLSVKGRTRGSDTVKIRSLDGSGKILKECMLGTPVAVFDIIDGWAELDGQGFHGMIQSKYVTLARETASAE